MRHASSLLVLTAMLCGSASASRPPRGPTSSSCMRTTWGTATSGFRTRIRRSPRRISTGWPARGCGSPMRTPGPRVVRRGESLPEERASRRALRPEHRPAAEAESLRRPAGEGAGADRPARANPPRKDRSGDALATTGPIIPGGPRSMNRLLALSTLLLAIPPAGPNASESRRPNFLFILVDDQSPFDLKVYNPDSPLETPHIDRLAREGLVFDGAYHMGAFVGRGLHAVAAHDHERADRLASAHRPRGHGEGAVPAGPRAGHDPGRLQPRPATTPCAPARSATATRPPTSSSRSGMTPPSVAARPRPAAPGMATG